jgi:hypothetical protein
MSKTVLHSWDQGRISLFEFFKAHSRKKLDQYHLFYVVKSHAEPKIFKVGISTGYSRLAEYQKMLGIKGETKCSGVFLYYLAGTKNSGDDEVDKKKLWSHKKERQGLAMLRSQIGYPRRGDERFDVSVATMKEVVMTPLSISKEERKDETLLRKTDYIVKVIGERKTKGKVEYKVRWNRGWDKVRTKKKDQNITWETKAWFKNASKVSQARLKEYLDKQATNPPRRKSERSKK